ARHSRTSGIPESLRPDGARVTAAAGVLKAIQLVVPRHFAFSDVRSPWGHTPCFTKGWLWRHDRQRQPHGTEREASHEPGSTPKPSGGRGRGTEPRGSTLSADVRRRTGSAVLKT